ncbi:hypothetical protein TetV_193 [Tetraselmis virus 1]|uniref:Uncharacterized protein n=1 Tax=Tetraselmis virus 1 TaxID=2060617 RepID=A0A2P0VMZ9_9VIRU|nr:hypothetical protein QJ968_gp193 [Tetraselmis virus 1]AUF82285.1 hypothetical protein TetV_193 [Tetraselmis virus 1]
MASGYSLNEVWGAQAMPIEKTHRSSKKSSKKKRKSSRIDPYCKNANLPEVMTAVIPEAFVPYDPISPLEMRLDEQESYQLYEPPEQHASREKEAEITELREHEKDTEHKQEFDVRNQPVTCPPQQIIQYVNPAPPRGDDKYDMFLYVFSGVLLLFLLEQFLQIGIHIGQRSV